MKSASIPHVPGSTIVVRTVTARRIRWASAAVCVRDDAEGIAFYQPNLTANKVTAGAAARWPDRRARELALRDELVRGDFELVDRIPAGGRPSLTVAHRRDWYSVRFVRNDAWQPEYVNVCLPFRRSTIGFDTDDLCLDIVIQHRPDGAMSCERKDDEDLDERAGVGIYTAEQVKAIREAGVAAIDHVRRRVPPFDGSWTDWSPDPSWTMPAGLPDTWDDDLVALNFN